MRENVQGTRRLSGLKLLTLGAVVAGILLAALGLFCRSGRRLPRARPLDGGFSVPLQRLCAHPGVAGHEWRYIVIHHSATVGGGAASFERYHIRARGWDSLAYHFVVGNGTQTGDGVIEVGPRWGEQRGGPHSGIARYNRRGIAVCLVGNFEEQRPTAQQLRSLHALVRYLMQCYGIPPERVLGHYECGRETKCPGRNFPMETFRGSLR